MKNNDFDDILGAVLIFLSCVIVLCCAVANAAFRIQHPDMTDMRLFLENPAPTIIAIIAMIVIWIGARLLK